jgi:hypothetical protein
VEVRFIQGDVTALRSAGVGSGFRLLLDFGTVHGLTDAQREAAGREREISAVAAAGAPLVILAWAPRHRWPLPRGMSRHDMQVAFREWKLIDEEPADVSRAPGLVKKAAPCFYRLRRE